MAKPARYISYLRVSTDKQGVKGLGIDAQRATVLNYLNGGSWELVQEYVEVESGKKSDRKELAAALAHCKAVNATLLIAKLDRLSRNLAFIANLIETRVPFIACDMPDADRTMLQIYAVMAEREAIATSERTKAALAAAKARGVKLGGYRAEAYVAGREAADRHASSVREAFQEAIQAGCASLREIAGHLNDSGCRTVSGALWTACAVSRVQARLGSSSV